MLNPSSTLIVTLIALPAILCQSTNTTNTTDTTTANNSTATSNTVTPTTFTPVLATGTSCGSAQQNFNQCITKVGKDISSCSDNVCLCQTYANIAACYNGCSDLSSQGDAYQAQSTQYCTIAGVKPNTTATTVTPATNTSSTSSTSTTPNSSSIRNGTATNSTSNSSTFSAAKNSASSNAATSTFGLLTGLVVALVALTA